MRSPCGSCVVVGSHLIADEGFPWWLDLDPSIWASCLCLRFLFAPCCWRRCSWWSSLRPRVLGCYRLSPLLLPLWGPPPVSLRFLSLGPSRSRSPIPSLAPSWWSPCPILRRALMSISCCVLRVPPHFFESVSFVDPVRLVAPLTPCLRWRYPSFARGHSCGWGVSSCGGFRRSPWDSR